MDPMSPLSDALLGKVGSFALVLDPSMAVDAMGRLTNPLLRAGIKYRCWYAVKCNPQRELLEALRNAGCGFEVASIPELESVIGLGVDPADIPYTNPVRSIKNSAKALALGVRMFTLDSYGEIVRLSRAAELSKVPVSEIKVVVRIKVTGEHAVWDLSGKFGVEDSIGSHFFSQVIDAGFAFVGLSFHVGSQTVNPCAWVTGIEKVANAVVLANYLGATIDLVDIGGGFPVSYGDPGITQDNRAAHEIMSQVVATWKSYEHLTSLTLAIEPGRFVAAPAVRYVCSIIGETENDDHQWLFVTVGTYNGPSESRETAGRIACPILHHKGSGHLLIPTTVTGPTCDGADVLTRVANLPECLTDGDILELAYAGAYSLSTANSFNGFAPPPKFMLTEDGRIVPID